MANRRQRRDFSETFKAMRSGWCGRPERPFGGRAELDLTESALRHGSGLRA